MSDFEAHGEFLNYYLDNMKQAEKSYGKRILDVLDTHFYSEARTKDVTLYGNNLTYRMPAYSVSTIVLH